MKPSSVPNWFGSNKKISYDKIVFQIPPLALTAMEGANTGLETGGAAALEMAAAAALERGDKIHPCRNCGAPVLGIYCGQCGQPIDTHRRSAIHLLHDFIKDIASFDSRILRTTRALFLQPGELALAFHEGRMQRYVPPVRLYLFVSFAFFLILSATHIAIMQLELTTTSKRYFTDASGKVLVEENGKAKVLPGLKVDKNSNIIVPRGEDDDFVGRKADGRVKRDLDVSPHFFTREKTGIHPVSAELRSILDRDEKLISGSAGKHRLSLFGMNGDPKRVLESLATDPSAINGPLTEWIPRVLFILLPLFAVSLAVFYWRQRADFYFVDHLVFSLNIFSFAFVAILLAIVLAQFLAGGKVVSIVFCAICLNLLLAMKRFYRQSWGWTAAKFTLVSLISAVFFAGPALIGIIIAVLWNLS